MRDPKLRGAWWLGMTALLAACTSQPTAPSPAPAPPSGPLPVTAPQPGGPKAPPAEAGRLETFDFTILSGPVSMKPGETTHLTARVMAPPGSRVVGLRATPGKDAFTYALKLELRLPEGEGSPAPLEVDIPFTPPANGTYYLDSARRFALHVGATPSWSGYGGYRTGAYYDYGRAPTPAPSAPAAPMWGTVTALETLTPGAVLGNPDVKERQLTGLQGPTTGRRGQRLTWTGHVWTAGTGPLRADLVQRDHELSVSALVAPAEQEPISAPMPREAQVTFSWTFQDPGTYRIVSGGGITLATVTIY